VKPVKNAPYLLERIPEGITVLPVERREGYGLYPNRTGELVKQLRAANVASQYLDPPEQRRWEDLKGEVTPEMIYLGLGLNLAANAIWFGLEVGLKKVFGNKKLKVLFVRQEADANGVVRNEWFEADGDAKGIAEAAKVLSNSDQR